MRQIWINGIRKHQQFEDNSINYNICIHHFDPASIKRTPSLVKLLPDVYPTIFPLIPPVVNDVPAGDLNDLPEEVDIDTTEPVTMICSDPVWYVNFTISHPIASYHSISPPITTYRYRSVPIATY